MRKGGMEMAPHRPTQWAVMGEREGNVTLRWATASGALCYGSAASTSLTREGSILLGRLPQVLALNWTVKIPQAFVNGQVGANSRKGTVLCANVWREEN